MADATLTIDAQGFLSPTDLSISPGDQITFASPHDDAVLCIDPEALFGTERIAVPQGTDETFIVQPNAPEGETVIVVHLGDLDADCMGSRGGQEQNGPSIRRT